MGRLPFRLQTLQRSGPWGDRWVQPGRESVKSDVAFQNYTKGNSFNLFRTVSKFAAAIAAYQTFTDAFQSIILSTVSSDGIPDASYAPFVMDGDRNIYIYVSGLSSHTQNLQAIPRASVLFIQDEQDTPQIFARKRLTYHCTARLIEADTEPWNRVVDQFEGRFGNMIQLLRTLPDFRIFQLKPTSGRFVVGFGAAYVVDGNDLNQLTHLQGEARTDVQTDPE